MPSSRDVISPSALDAFGSPYPLGLGIYTCSGDQSIAKPLPLYYVSPVVAADRSPNANIDNSAGVKPGWYAVAEPGPFEVRITRVNSPFPCSWPENLLTTHLFVDGVCTNDSRIFHESRQIYGESVIFGFVERIAFSPTGAVEKDVRRFEFGRAKAVQVTHEGDDDEEDEDGNEEAATICLESMVGVGVYTEDVSAIVNEFGYEGRSGVSEKDVTKDGRSLEVKVDGDKIPDRRSACKYRAVRERPCPEASVTVFVRERAWMRSRKLVDDNGMACTHGMYLELLRKDGVRGGEVNGFGRRNLEDGFRRRRGGGEAIVIDLDGSSTDSEVEAVVDLDANVIDLT